MAYKDRYACWAGISHEKYLDVMASVFNGAGEGIWRKKVKEMRFEILWPIVDNETCGAIDGFPRPDQMCAFAFSPTVQREICDALNLQDAFRKIGNVYDKAVKRKSVGALFRLLREEKIGMASPEYDEDDFSRTMKKLREESTDGN